MTDTDFLDNDIASKYLEYSKNTRTTNGIVQFLKFCRTTRTGYPSHIAKLGSTIIDQGYGNIIDKDELYLIIEQTCIAYLLLHNIPQAETYLTVLTKEIGNNDSSRILRLRGLITESKGNIATATDTYNEHLTKNPNNAALHKRLVATYKADENYTGALKALSSYLEKFCSDTDAWLEMTELQIMLSAVPSVKNYNPATNRIPHAIFCMEELLLLQPNNAAFHTRISDLWCRSIVEQGLPSFTHNSLFYPNNSNPTTVSLYQQYKAIDTKTDEYIQLIYSLRNARLHAAEGVRLTKKKNFYALCALADACYLHYCAVTRQPFLVQGRLLLGSELGTMVNDLTNYYRRVSSEENRLENTSHNNNSSVPPMVGKDEEDDYDLHNLAYVHIKELTQSLSSSSSVLTQKEPIRVGSSSEPSSSSSPTVTIQTVYPAVEVEHLFATNKTVQSILQLQKDHMRY